MNLTITLATSLPVSRVGVTRSVESPRPGLAPGLQALLARAVQADQQLKLSLQAFTQAMQAAASAGHDVRVPEDIGEWLSERNALQPMRLESPAADDTPPLTQGLTRKEMSVLDLLTHGHSNAGMAERLFVSESTVRTHLRSINHKLQAQSRTQAVAIARRLGLVAP